MNSQRLLVTAVALFSAIATAACTDVSGNADAVLSIEFDSLPSPSVVVGDTLRDTTGVIVTPVVRAFNFDGDEIAAAPIRFQSPDSGVKVDSLTGVITADSLRSTAARIFATVGSLQALQRVDVTLRPDSLFAVDSVDTLSYSVIDSTVNVSQPLTVKLVHGRAPNDSAAKSWLVSFAIVEQSDPSLGELVNDGKKTSRIDSTNADGVAGRAIRLHSNFLKAPLDSIIVEATAKYRGAPVAGSPVRLVVVLRPRG
jgi:hypothetical protein